MTCATDVVADQFKEVVADQFKEFVRSLDQSQLDALAQTIGQFKNDTGTGSGQIGFAGTKTELVFEQGVLMQLESKKSLVKQGRRHN